MGNIRWLKKDEQLLKKKVRNNNAKIKRLMDKNYNIDMLPEKLSLKTEREKAKQGTRKQFKEQVKLVDEVLKRGSEDIAVKSDRGLSIPKFKFNQIEIKRKAINRERKKEKLKYEKEHPTDRNKPLGGTVGDYRDMNVNKLKPKVFNWEHMSKKDFQMFNRTLYEYGESKNEKDEKYRANFYKAMENHLSEEQFSNLKKILDLVPTDKLINKYFTDINMGIKFAYEPLEQQAIYEESIDSWNSVVMEGGY